MATPVRMLTNVQMAAALVGAVFVLIGVAGFVPGITTDVGDMRFAGHESGSELLGVFQVSVLHNLVHLAFGVAGLMAAASIWPARTYLVGGGIVYLVLWAYGLSIDHASDANFVPVDNADDWLHFGLGVVMIALGMLLAGGGRAWTRRRTARHSSMAGDQPVR